MDDKNLILKLNNYGYSQQVVDEVLEYKTTGEIPEHIKGKKRYREKWAPFYVQNNYLIYRPKELKVIIDPAEKQEILKRLYDDDRSGVGSGIVQFYQTVCRKYLNIFRTEVAEFLKRQKNYQLSRNTRHVINKPILASQPNERWAIDLVDMQRYETKNRGYKYILTCIDHYSRRVWAKPLKNKTAEDVSLAIGQICEDAGVYPHILQKDNGGEFQGETNEFMEQHNIKWINTLSYSPQSNGLIENFNNQLRKMLREIMIRHNDLVWYNRLDLCCSIKNRQRNGTTKKRPIDVWEATNFRRLRPMRNQEVAENIREKARQNVLKNKTIEFNANDYVRVKLSQLYSQVRKMIKDGDKKFIVVKYSPEVYQIDKILKPDHEGYEKLRYTLKTLDGQPLLTQQKMNNPNKPRRQKRFFASDFLKVSKEDVDNNMNDGFTIHDALKLNVVRDEETEAKKPKKPRATRIEKERVPIVQREKSTRAKKANSLLRDFVLTTETTEPPPPQEERLKLSIPRALWNDGLQRKNTEKPVKMPEPPPQEERLKLSIPRALWNDGLNRKNTEKPVKSKEPVREKSTRVKKPNSMLKDFVGNGVIIGGVIHNL